MTTTPSMRTPLGKVRGLGSAKSGADHFWKQRLTALANIPLTLAFILIVLASFGKSFAKAYELLAHPLVAIIMLLTILSSIVHMHLGMQVIIEDYIASEGKKIAAIIANTFFSVVIGMAASFAILKLAFGG